MARLPQKPERGKADKRQNGSTSETGSPEKCKRIEIIPGLDPIPIQIRKLPVQENSQDAEIVPERLQVGIDKFKKENTEAPCCAFRPIEGQQTCNTYLGATLWQKEGEVFRPNAFASRCITDCEKICN